MHDIKYNQTHDIDILLGLLPENPAYLAEDYELTGSMITEWESKTRYIKNYFLEYKRVSAIIKVVENTLQVVESLHLDNIEEADFNPPV